MRKQSLQKALQCCSPSLSEEDLENSSVVAYRTVGMQEVPSSGSIPGIASSKVLGWKVMSKTGA